MDDFTRERAKVFVNTLMEYQERHNVMLEDMSLRELVSEMKKDEKSKAQFISISEAVDRNMAIDAIVLINNVGAYLGKTSPEYIANGSDVFDQKLKVLEHINSN